MPTPRAWEPQLRVAPEGLAAVREPERHRVPGAEQRLSENVLHYKIVGEYRTEVEAPPTMIPCFCVSRFGDNPKCPKHGGDRSWRVVTST